MRDEAQLRRALGEAQPLLARCEALSSVERVRVSEVTWVHLELMEEDGVGVIGDVHFDGSGFTGDAFFRCIEERLDALAFDAPRGTVQSKIPIIFYRAPGDGWVGPATL